MKMNTLSNKKGDYLGITGSTLCLIHCLAMPFLFALMASKPSFEIGLDLDYIFLFINFIAVYWVSQSTHWAFIKISLWFFWGFLALTTLLTESYAWFEYLTYLASLGLIMTHLYNIRCIRSCAH